MDFHAPCNFIHNTTTSLIAKIKTNIKLFIQPKAQQGAQSNPSDHRLLS